MIIDNATGDDLDFIVQDQPIDGSKEEGKVIQGAPPVQTIKVEGPFCKVRLTPSKGSDLENFTWEARKVPVEATVKFREGADGERHIEISKPSSY